MTYRSFPSASTLRSILSKAAQFFKELYWPPTPAHLRALLSFLWGVPGSTIQVLVPVFKALREGRDIYEVWETLLTDQDLEEMRHPNLEKFRTPSAAQVLAELIPDMERVFQEGLIPHSYVVETREWIHAILKAREPNKIAQILRQRVDDTLRGRYMARFTRVTLESPNTDVIAALRDRDGARALRMLENMTTPELAHDFVPDAQTALVHLIVSDEGTFAILTTAKETTVLRNADLTRARVSALLRAWLWLYYWHSHNIFEKVIDYLVSIGNIDSGERQSFEESLSQHLYRFIFYNEHVMMHFQPTEVSQSDGIPTLPFPSWILMEVVLRELGVGYLKPGNGLWQQINEKLYPQEIKRIVLFPDEALALFPHHGAILNIAHDGQKEYMLDRYEIVLVPQSKFPKPISAELQSPRLLVFGTDGDPLSDAGIANLHVLAPENMREWHPSSRREQIATDLSSASAFTFIGHGEYNWEEPSQSFLGLLSDGKDGFNDVLSLENLIELIPPQLDLIVLAGCETGLPKITASMSDYKGFAEDLFSRRSVSTIISTLWPVRQISTVLLIRQFHRYLLLGDSVMGEKPVPPAKALRNAQLWLRALTRQQAIVELETLASIYPTDEIAKEIQSLRDDVVEHPYAHPYFWSTFYVMGGVQ
jgi:CHAT domain-containing protein